MTLRYDQTLETLLRILHREDCLQRVARGLIVRTQEGRLRLAITPNPDQQPFVEALTQRLEQALGPWFLGPVLSTQGGSPGLRRLASNLLDSHTTWPSSWPTALPALPGLPPVRVDTRWSARQIAVSKAPWLAVAPATPPWPLREKTPTLTAFYGYKGGVGRTTAVAALARLLAGRGERVVCLDLDLEAPGLARQLTGEALPPDRGWLIDDLISHSATGRGLDELPTLRAEENLWLVPAGGPSDTYLDKLARLDTMHHGSTAESPVHAALTALLRRIRRELHPHHIFLDSRSGLHDLAGLALHHLSHVDVLVGRGDAQELDGLQMLLPALLRHRRAEDRRMLVLRTFHQVPVDQTKLTEQRSELYDLLSERFYEEAPDVNAEGAAHDPVAIIEHSSLKTQPTLAQIPLQTLTDVYGAALERLGALWAPEDP